MRTENLVVGLGIAGINLCQRLSEEGRSFVVVDSCPARSSSIIAGGIYNPIVIKRKVRTWKADLLFDFLVPHYGRMEHLLGRRFLHHEFPIVKPITSAHELDEWQAAIDSGAVTPYVTEVARTPPDGPYNPAVLGNVTIRHAGFVRLEEAILGWRGHLASHGLLVEEAFDHSRLETLPHAVRYGDVEADRVIFCEGSRVRDNPWFNWVPLRPTKGQMLTIGTDSGLAPDRVYNHQFYLFPAMESGHFRLGATYEWNDLSDRVTDEAREELCGRVQKVLDIDVRTVDQQAAIRPNVADRRPLLGHHPGNHRLLLFNGMGSKGVMLAPYFAHQLVRHIYEEGALDPEADLTRFIRRYELAQSRPHGFLG